MGQSRCFRPTVSGVLSPLKERTFIIGPRANRYERFSLNRTGFRLYSSDDQAPSQTNSVSRIVYEDDPKIHVKLFTKEGCTLCDKVKEVLEGVRQEQPHTLEAVDITDKDKLEYWSKYKYDIPVLLLNDKYWTKHRLTAQQAMEGLNACRTGQFLFPAPGEPNAGAMEHRLIERKKSDA